MIIISASGMCEAGRIKHHLKHNLWKDKSTILFVGYQAEGTLGRRLVEGAKKVTIFGEEITVNARIEMIDGFSGHADKDGLLEWLGQFSKKPEKVFIVHGEEAVMKDFSKLINDRFNIETVIPARGESYVITAGGAWESAEEKEKVAAYCTFKRLELLDLMDKIKEEFNELCEIIKTDLKQEKDDSEVEELKVKLKKLEKSMVDVLR